MNRLAHDRSEPLIVEHYAGLKAEVIATVRGTNGVGNLGGWLATITCRRAIDDIEARV